jgi:hypothetical protein
MSIVLKYAQHLMREAMSADFPKCRVSDIARKTKMPPATVSQIANRDGMLGVDKVERIIKLFDPEAFDRMTKALAPPIPVAPSLPPPIEFVHIVEPGGRSTLRPMCGIHKSKVTKSVNIFDVSAGLAAATCPYCCKRANRKPGEMRKTIIHPPSPADVPKLHHREGCGAKNAVYVSDWGEVTCDACHESRQSIDL